MTRDTPMTEDTVAEILLKDRLRLTAFLRSIVADRALAEDLFQEVCISAIRQPERFAERDHLLRWARRVGKHRAIDALRARKRVPQLSLDAIGALEQHAVSQATGGSESSGSLRALELCLRTLTPNARRVLALRYGENLSGRDVASRLGRKVDAVYKNLSRIYTHLRDCIRARINQETC